MILGTKKMWRKFQLKICGENFLIAYTQFILISGLRRDCAN